MRNASFFFLLFLRAAGPIPLLDEIRDACMMEGCIVARRQRLIVLGKVISLDAWTNEGRHDDGRVFGLFKMCRGPH